MRDYIQYKLDLFNRAHCIKNKLDSYEGDYKKQWKKDYNQTSNLRAEIKSVSDVHSYIDSYVCSVEREQKLNVRYLDIYDTDVALYRATYAISKMACCYDNNNFDFHTLGKKEIDEMFSVLEKTHSKMKDELMRRSMYD